MLNRLLEAGLKSVRSGLGAIESPPIRWSADSTFALPQGFALDEEAADPLAQMALADLADRHLLRLVLCAAGATLALALTASLF